PACACPLPPIRSLRPSRSPRPAPGAPDKSNTTGGLAAPLDHLHGGLITHWPSPFHPRRRKHIIALQLVKGFFDFFTASDARATFPRTAGTPIYHEIRAFPAEKSA